MINEYELKAIQQEIDRVYWQLRATSPQLRKLSMEKGKDVVTNFLLKVEMEKLNDERSYIKACD